jgi:cytochrome P450
MLALLLLQVDAMSYTDAAIHESMRLHVPPAILGNTALKDVVVGGITIPKGTDVVISQSKVAVSDKYFTNAKQFWPEVRGHLYSTCVPIYFEAVVY